MGKWKWRDGWRSGAQYIHLNLPPKWELVVPNARWPRGRMGEIRERQACTNSRPRLGNDVDVMRVGMGAN